MAKRAKVNKAPVISGLEGTDVTLTKQSFRIGPKIGQGGFGLIYLGLSMWYAGINANWIHRRQIPSSRATQPGLAAVQRPRRRRRTWPKWYVSHPSPHPLILHRSTPRAAGCSAR